MAESLRDLVEILSQGGPADAVRAGMGGFQQGRQQAQASTASDFDARKAAFELKLKEAGLFDTTELGDLPTQAGVSLKPGRNVTESAMEKLISLKNSRDLTADKTKAKQDMLAPLGADEIEANARAIELSGAPNAKELAKLFRTSAPRVAADKGANLAARLMGIATPAATTADAPERARISEAKRVYNDRQRSLAEVENTLTKMELAANELGDFDTGLVGQGLAKGKMFLGGASSDPKVAKYRQTIAQEISNLTRNAGQTGVLTDQDIVLGREGAGKETAPLQQKLDALNGIRANAYVKAAAAAEQAGDYANARVFLDKAAVARSKMFRGSQGDQQQAVPTVGQTFNGGKVLKVTRVQ